MIKMLWSILSKAFEKSTKLERIKALGISVVASHLCKRWTKACVDDDFLMQPNCMARVNVRHN